MSDPGDVLAARGLPAIGPDTGAVRVADLSRLVGFDPPRFRRADVEQLVGLDHEHMVRWWRAMGFAEVPPDEQVFASPDVDMAARLAGLLELGPVSEDEVLRLARLLGASFSRIADVQAALLDDVVTRHLDPGDGSRSSPDEGDTLPAPASTAERLAALDSDEARAVLAMFEDSLVYVWRRHLLATLGRWIGPEDATGDQAVGFVDISGFTRLSKSMSPDEIAGVVDAFESTAMEVVSEFDGRVVKLIGDEVMFVADSAGDAVDIGLELADRLATAEDPLAVHAGIAHGPTVTVGGDVFGPTVNLASRLCDVARRGRIVVTREAALDLVDRDDLEVQKLRRVFDLKGIGRTRLCSVRRLQALDPRPPQ
jgi:adenylate cyclase